MSEQITEKAEKIFEEYQANFAGQPRATRDGEYLDDLIERLEAVLGEARDLLNGGEDEALVSTIEQADENLQIYRTEREAIARVQSQGEGVLEAGRLAEWANAEFHRYQRHFAGSARATRDNELLNEMIAELKVIREQMRELNESDDVEGVEEDLETVETNLEHYRGERERIVEAQHSGSNEERASYLAEIANGQFDLYRTLFSGKDRVSRRPKLLRRMIRTLESTRRQMRKLEERGLNSQENSNNIQIVSDNIETYEEELQAIESARESVGAEELAGYLGGAANKVFEQYRDEFAGENRSTRDLHTLTRMCDELYHIGREMQSIGEREDIEMNQQNLRVVLDNLALYQREYDEIQRLSQDQSVGSQ